MDIELGKIDMEIQTVIGLCKTENEDRTIAETRRTGWEEEATRLREKDKLQIKNKIHFCNELVRSKI